MASKVEKLDGNKAKIEINVSPDEFEKGINQAYQKNKAKFSIPGFRKGKAPRTILENHFGKELFYEDAFEEIFPTAYKNAVDEQKLEVVSRLGANDVDVLEMDRDNGLTFTVTVTLKPDVELGAYEGLNVKKPIFKISEKDIDREIEKIREQNARWIDTVEAANDGDSVLIDYSGSINDEVFDGGTAQDQTLILGSKQFIPGFEDQIIGMKKGEDKDITVIFPENYTPELAGKDAVFKINVKEVRKKELPDLDDDFAQDISEFDTLDEYKTDVKKNLEAQAELRSKVEVENQVLQAAADNAKVDIPDVMIENYIDHQINQLRYQLMYQGIRLEDYLQYMGNTMDDLRASYKVDAGEQVKMRLTIDKLIDELDINPTDEDVEKYMEKLAADAGKTLQEYKNMLSNEELDYFKDRVAMERLFDYLVSKAEVEEIDGGDLADADKPNKASDADTETESEGVSEEKEEDSNE